MRGRSTPTIKTESLSYLPSISLSSIDVLSECSSDSIFKTQLAPSLSLLTSLSHQLLTLQLCVIILLFGSSKA